MNKLKRKQMMFGFNTNSVLDIFLGSCTQKGIYIAVLPQAMDFHKEILHDLFGDYKKEEMCKHCGAQKTAQDDDGELFGLLADSAILLISFDSLADAFSVYQQIGKHIHLGLSKPNRDPVEVWQHGKKVEHNRLPWLLHVDNR